MLAVVFPGQGSQKVGMGRALAARFAVARRTFEEADEALGFDLTRIGFEGPEEELRLTANAQPAILATSIAIWRALQQRCPIAPGAVAGHSLGEYTALVCAGALTFADALRLVHLRGRLMQQAVPAGTGGMAALIGLEERAVVQLCADAAGDEVLEPANFNGAGQVVIAGDLPAVQRALSLARKRGARGVPLRVSAPFHCSLMQPAAEGLAAALETVPIRRPEIPVVSNVDAEPNQEPGRVARLLVRQMTAPVRWEASVRRLVAMGCEQVVEVGPGKVLSGLIRRTAAGLSLQQVEDPDHVESFGPGGGQR